MSRRVKLTFVLLIAFALILALPVSLPGEMGAVDFRPYWSSTALLARGQDFGDPEIVDRFEREQTGWQKPYTMLAWFVPTGNVVLLPYSLFPFERAVFFWLLTNIAVVFTSALLIGRASQLPPWMALAAAFSFSMTLLSLIAGQINTLVLLGLALFIYFSEKQLHWAAGASLALVTIKPHLVILTLPLLVLHLLRGKQLRVLGGLGAALLGCAVILFALNPTWPASFWRLVSLGLETNRETPTLSGLLLAAGWPGWGKWLFVPAGLIAGLLWWARGRRWQLRAMIDLSLMVGLVVSPIGWSYDQVVLLLPLLRVLAWAVDGSLSKKASTALVAGLVFANLAAYVQRILSPSDVGFFWVPLFVLGVYLIAWQRTMKPVSV